MKIIELNNVIACPLCTFEPELLRNASKDFQLRCPNCGARTGWGKKADVIIQWYNMVFQYLRNTGGFSK